jgi:hypothetical protein
MTMLGEGIRHRVYAVAGKAIHPSIMAGIMAMVGAAIRDRV